MNFDLAELPRDVNRMLDGTAYRVFTGINDMHAHRNVRSGVQGVWSGRMHELASDGERKVFYELEANPFILAIREQYPLAPDSVMDDLLAGKPVAANRVMTIDFVVTLPPKNFGGPLRYQGLYRKPKNLASTAAGERRKSKEQRALEVIGWEWTPTKVPSDTRVANLLKLRQWAKAWPIDFGARQGAELARLLYATTSTKPLGKLLPMLGRRIGIPTQDLYFTFAAAFYFGYVNLEKEAVLDEGAPLRLAPPSRKPSGIWLYG